MTRMSGAEFRRLLSELRRIGHELSEQDPERSERLLEMVHSMGAQTLAHEMPEPSVLRDLGLLMADLGIDYALIGGMAVAVHGVARGTDDINVLVERLPAAETLRDREYLARFGFYPAKSRTGTVVTLDHRQGQVEMLTARDPLERWALGCRAPHNVLGSTVPVVAADALIALKARAMTSNPRREANDKPDVLSVWLKSRPDLKHVWPLLSEREAENLASVVGGRPR